MEQYNFRHHPDGFIFINGDFECTLEEWLQMEPEYTLPEFFVGREYSSERGVQRLYTLTNEIFIREPWTAGDSYVANKELYITQLETIRAKAEGEISA